MNKVELELHLLHIRYGRIVCLVIRNYIKVCLYSENRRIVALICGA